MILIDYSQIAIASILQFQTDLKHGSDEKIVNLIRHVVFSSLLANKKKYSPKYGEMVICADGRDYWRKEHFEYYKASRKKTRDASDLNWKLIFDTISSVREDLKENFPYKVLHVERAEADDIIGVLCKYYQDNELATEGLVEEPQEILIVSSDRDNVQLQKYRNVKQWSPMQKKFVKPDTNAREALIEKIVTGDSGDCVPNILSDDDVFVIEGKRQKPFKRARLQDFYARGIEACNNDTERRNYQRNELLVSYEKIPEDVASAIIDTYKACKPVNSKTAIMTYFMKHKMKNLMTNIEDF